MPYNPYYPARSARRVRAMGALLVAIPIVAFAASCGASNDAEIPVDPSVEKRVNHTDDGYTTWYERTFELSDGRILLCVSLPSNRNEVWSCDWSGTRKVDK